VNRQAGTQKGSLAYCVGDALGVKHVGKHTGMVQSTKQADWRSGGFEADTP